MPRRPFEEFSYKTIALMPFQGTILWSLVGLTLFLYMSFLAGPLFGTPLYVLSIVAMVRYAQIIIHKMVHGYSEPPALSPKDFNLFENLGALGFYVILSLAALAGFLLGGSNEMVQMALSALLVFALPAMLAASAVDNSLSSAFNPVLITRIIRLLGLRYVLVCALVTTGYLGSSWLAEVQGSALLRVAAGVYGLFLISCGMGHLLYTARHDLGLNITTLKELRDQSDHKLDVAQDSDALKAAAQMSRVSATDAAGSLWAYHTRNHTSLARKHAALDALKRWDNPLTALHFARALVGYLVQQDLLDQAVDLVRWSLTTEPAFRLEHAEQTKRVGDHALKLGQYRTAAHLMQDMGLRHPQHADTIPILLIVGKLAGERLNDETLLEHVITQLRQLAVADSDPRLQPLLTLKNTLSQ